MTPRERAFFLAFGYLSLLGFISWTGLKNDVLIPIGTIVLGFPSNVLIYALLKPIMDKSAHLSAWIFAADMLSGTLNAAFAYSFSEWRRKR